MILAEIYGDTPRANIEKFSSAPPPIALNNSQNPKLDIAPSVPGTGIVVPSANISNPNKVNAILFLISLFLGLKINFRFLNI